MLKTVRKRQLGVASRQHNLVTSLGNCLERDKAAAKENQQRASAQWAASESNNKKRGTGIEPVTLRAAIERSTTELPAHRTIPTPHDISQKRLYCVRHFIDNPAHAPPANATSSRSSPAIPRIGIDKTRATAPPGPFAFDPSWCLLLDQRRLNATRQPPSTRRGLRYHRLLTRHRPDLVGYNFIPHWCMNKRRQPA
jgi:hypothetical protein